ncbi:MAG: glycosyltransferase family 2 protein [bacterium]
MESVKLSSIMVVRDSELTIGKSIDSQIGCIDNILIIIDRRTTDRTIEIIKSKKVNYEIIEWKGYAQTKQCALDKTENDWVLWIDGDEVITDELKKELVNFKTNPPDKVVAFQVARRAFFLGKWIKHGGWYPSRVTRLFNKNFAHFDNRSVHEGIVITGETGRLTNDLEHYTDPNLKHYFEKFNNYTSLAAGELHNKNRKFSLISLLIRPLFLLLKMYIFRLGFLDGIRGFILAVLSSHYVFVKYAKLWEKENISGV